MFHCNKRDNATNNEASIIVNAPFLPGCHSFTHTHLYYRLLLNTLKSHMIHKANFSTVTERG